jgi:hypothetical protein
LIDPLAGVAVWLGASLVVVADGRRGQAAGIAVATVGMAVLTFVTAGGVAAGALAIGGGVAAARRSVSGPAGWDILPPGSTPRLVLCIATAIVAFWVAAGVTSGPVASLRFAIMVGVALSAARVLSSTERSALLTALALLAITVASVGAIGSDQPTVWPYLVGGLVAALVGWWPLRTLSAA